MKRKLIMLVGCVILVGIAMGSFRVDSYSRYHSDTLREERFEVTRVFGIPIWRKAHRPHDEFSGVYTEITGEEPNPDRWCKMSPDHTRTLMMEIYRCGAPFLVRAREELLEALFRRYADGMAKTDALELFRRIDCIVPAVRVRETEIDLKALDEIRVDLGFERRFAIGDEESVAEQAAADETK